MCLPLVTQLYWYWVISDPITKQHGFGFILPPRSPSPCLVSCMVNLVYICRTMDLGTYSTHYFYDVDLMEDFYRYIAPSEDIWKKFELVPSCSQSSAGCTAGSSTDWASDHVDLGWESPVKLSCLSSVVLRRDCMWSGFSTRERLEKVIQDRISNGNTRTSSAAKQVPDTEPLETGPDVTEQTLPVPPPQPLVPTPAPEKVQHSSGSESSTDSDDDDDDEIDVVTVEKRKSCGGRQPVTITVRADPLDPTTKLFHISIHQQQHNYAARPPEQSPLSPPPSPPAEEPGEVSCMSAQPCSPPTPSSTPGSSDGEDFAKRKNHNYMERKRRNDLRSRFMELREKVPGLSHSSKTSKVVVLSKATEYLKGLITEEQRLLNEKLKLRAHQKRLKSRLAKLKGR
uniref:MYCL proto-onco, bHLH transcription factor n=1 Tax=Leptobrachium leishanense TaxID=445787 RepID=A0A8C5MBR2_9ANUR